jgi:hypothetical protein
VKRIRIVPVRTASIFAAALLLCGVADGSPAQRAPDRPLRSPTDSIVQIKPITGTWFNIQWPDERYRYMNERQAAFTCADWETKTSEMAEIGIRYIVLQSVAQGGKAFYRSNLMPGAGLACDDPVGAVMRAAEKHGMKVFLSCEFVKDENDNIGDPRIMARRKAIMREVAARFGASPAFYGWYLAHEGDAAGFGRAYVNYVNALASEARTLTPGAKILIAPQRLSGIKWNAEYRRILESMDIDIVAYQDQVGRARSLYAIGVSRKQFAHARSLHDRIPRIALWADIETFAWEGSPNSPRSALVPAPFPRVLEQMEAVSPYVGQTLAFTMQGMADKPGSPAPDGHPTAGEQYREYVRFLEGDRDMLVLEEALAGHVRHAAVGARVVLNARAEAAGGGSELTDGATGSTYNRTDGWVAFRHGALDITVDLGTRMKLDYIGIFLLAERWSRIYLPERVSFSVSDDGARYESIGDVELYPWHVDTRRDIVAAPHLRKKARYVRITSTGLRIPEGVAPPDTTILASEIIINPRLRGDPGSGR